ncbi:MAG: ABC transporter ATP-binding protein [Verrucomicrobiales bacterium]|nr:ABC transporter ATP-binding protein [Verrucomicrobiales bacterium]
MAETEPQPPSTEASSPEGKKLLLEVEGLTIERRLPDGEIIRAPDAVSLWVNRGEILAIAGERGSGKSAIAQALAGLPAPRSRIIHGEVLLEGESLLKTGRSRLRQIRRKRIAFLEPDPKAQFNPFITVRQHLRETIRLAERQSELADESEWSPIFYEVGIVEPEKVLDHLPDTLSPDLALRIMLATALFAGVELLICNQALTGVEPYTRTQVMNLLKQMRDERNLAILLTTDNLREIETVADRAIVLFEGGIAEIGTPERILKSPKCGYTRALIECIPRAGSDRARLGEIDTDALHEGRIAVHRNSSQTY